MKKNIEKHKTIECDICGEEWEEDFFCKKCSNQIYYELEEVIDLFWDYDMRTDGYITEEVAHYSGDVCKNCCQNIKHYKITK